MTLREAYDGWIATFPGYRKGLDQYQHTASKEVYTVPENYDGFCCPQGQDHVQVQDILVERPNDERVMVQKLLPLPDSRVCARERAWRKYISIRDGKNYCIADRTGVH